MKQIFIILLVLIVTDIGFSKRRFPNFYGDINPKKIVQASDPLILTPLLENGQIEEAQAASKVNFSEFGNVKSYSGYFTVDKIYNSNLFFWFFPAYENYEDAPVILWLQGGPGSTSLYGLFQENGPFVLTEEGTSQLRNITWASIASVLYIDNPAGTGFSFTNGGFAENQTKVGDDLYSALTQFFTLFPDLQSHDFYITGESYAGKYVPAISYTILQRNPEANLKIPLKGLAIGNGLSDPLHQFKYGDRFYELGLIDSQTNSIYKDYEQQGVQYILQENWVEAMNIFSILIDGDAESLFWKVTGIDNVYNCITPSDSSSDLYLEQFLSRPEVRDAIHVGNTDFSSGHEVWDHLVYDIPKSVAPWVEALLENYQVLIYNGQLDLIVPYPPTVDFLNSLNFSGADEYKNARRNIWYCGRDNDLCGYFKSAGNLVEVLVRNAGHMVPGDQPEWALELIKAFVSKRF